MSGIATIIVFIVIFSYFGIWLNIKPYRKANKLIEKWAHDNGYEVLEKRKKIGFDTGPYTFGGYTAIHKILIVDRNGCKRKAWTKTGNYMWPFSCSFRVHIENL